MIPRVPSERAGDIRLPTSDHGARGQRGGGGPPARSRAGDRAGDRGRARGDEVLRFDDPRAAELQAGDRLVCLCSNAA